MTQKSGSYPRPRPILLGLVLYVAWAAMAFRGGDADSAAGKVQSALRKLLGLTLLVHAGEALLVSWRVRRLGYPEQSRSWALSTVLWGVLNIGRLRQLPKA